MSTHKPSSQQKISLEARVYENLHHSFPDFPCSITDIKFPKPEFVIRFYTFILEEMRFDVSKLTTGLLEHQLEGVPHHELYLKNMPLYNLSRALGTVLNRLMSGDKLQFGLDDLLEPNVSRNSIFMFNLLNFFSFADARVHELVDKLEVIDQCKSEAGQLLEKREMLSREINQRALTKVKRADYAKEIKSKKAEIEELQKESKSVEQVSEVRLAELEETKKKLVRIQSEISQAKETCHKLEAQQVQSPDAIKNDFKNMQAKLEETKQQLREAQEKSKERKSAIAKFENVEKGQDIRLELLNEIVSKEKSIKDLENQIADMQRKHKSAVEETIKSQAILKDLMRDSAELSHQLTNIQLQWENKKRNMEEEIRFLQDEKRRLETKESEGMEKVRQEMFELQAEINELIQLNKNNNKIYEKQYAALMEQEREFCERKNAQAKQLTAELQRMKESKSQEKY